MCIPSRTSCFRTTSFALFIVVASTLVTACSLSDLTQVDRGRRGDIIDQDVMESPEGARGAYFAAVAGFANVLSVVSRTVGHFTDELTVRPGLIPTMLELRRLESASEGEFDNGTGGVYKALQASRIRTQQAGDLVRRFGGPSGSAMLAHMYAIRAYTTILLGELHCSGIPLTSVPYGGELAYTAGITTSGIFERALVLADSGILIATDSIPVLTMLRIARGRALLNLGKFSEAAAAVAAVETVHRATVTYEASSSATPNFWVTSDGHFDRATVKNARGGNGLRWLADTAIRQDPRIPVSKTANGQQFQAPVRPLKFPRTSAITLVVADGIEARLIEAESLLQPAQAPVGNWLAVLNTLRRTALPAGASLSDTTDPGTANGRLDLLFRERAFWFYLTGHRLGDLRRLVRQYGRSPIEVYPFGVADGSTLFYGDEYVLIPAHPNANIELDANPYYRGCEDLNP